MRSLIVTGLLAGAVLSSAAFAQSAREIRKDERTVQTHQEDLRQAQERASRSDIREAREDLREARQKLHEDRRDQRRSAYVSPYRNWSYSSVSEGTRLRPRFYGWRYAISDPGARGLDRAARNQRWVRYGNDILLVNVRNGRVLQVMPNRYRDM